MIIRLVENQTVYDLCLMVNGNCDNIIQFINDNGIDSLDTDLTGRVFELKYNTNIRIVNDFFINSISVSTGDPNLYESLVLENTSKQFNADFDANEYD